LISQPTLIAAHNVTTNILLPFPSLHFSGVKANTQKKGGDEKKVGGGGAAGQAARSGIPADARTCALCKTPFNARAPKVQLMEHVDSKHSKLGFDACFPGYVA